MKSKVVELEKLDKNTPVNLVLSGGGAKCAAHIALLEKLEELGLTINSISASSGGSLVASMYASGLTTQEILKAFEETPLFKVSYFSFTKAGIFDLYYYRTALEKLIKPTFEELQIPLIVTASNMESGKIRYFKQGKLLKPVLASCAIPGIFTPVKIDNVLYSDGGVLDNFPIKPFSKSEFPIVGSYVGNPPERTKKELNTTFKVLVQAGFLLSHSAESFKFKKADITIKFPVYEFSALDNKEVVNIYRKCKEYLEKEM